MAEKKKLTPDTGTFFQQEFAILDYPELIPTLKAFPLHVGLHPSYHDDCQPGHLT